AAAASSSRSRNSAALRRASSTTCGLLRSGEAVDHLRFASIVPGPSRSRCTHRVLAVPMLEQETSLARVRRARRIDRALAETYPEARCELDFADAYQLLV